MSIGHQCPKCGKFETLEVNKSYAIKGGKRRDCRCRDCGYNVPTFEQVGRKRLLVIKRDGRREVFKRKKVYRGVQLACVKNTEDVEIDRLTNKICFIIHEKYGVIGEVTSDDIGWVHLGVFLQESTAIGKMAYYHFAPIFFYTKDPDHYELLFTDKSIQMRALDFVSGGVYPNEVCDIGELQKILS